MYPVGVLFGLGFDTATEVALMVMAGAGAAAGLPWYAILVPAAAVRRRHEPVRHPRRLLHERRLPLGVLQPGPQGLLQPHHHRPVRRGRVDHRPIELVSVLHDNLGLEDAVTDWISGIDLDNVGYVIVGLFVVVWAGAIAYWRLADVEHRWNAKTANAD